MSHISTKIALNTKPVDSLFRFDRPLLPVMRNGRIYEGYYLGDSERAESIERTVASLRKKRPCLEEFFALKRRVPPIRFPEGVSEETGFSLWVLVSASGRARLAAAAPAPDLWFAPLLRYKEPDWSYASAFAAEFKSRQERARVAGIYAPIAKRIAKALDLLATLAHVAINLHYYGEAKRDDAKYRAELTLYRSRLAALTRLYGRLRRELAKETIYPAGALALAAFLGELVDIERLRAETTARTKRARWTGNLLPLHGGGRLARNIVSDAVDARHFVDDARGHSG